MEFLSQRDLRTAVPMASCICSIVRGDGGFCSMPFNDSISGRAATMEYWPLAARMNSTWSPIASPNVARTDAGSVMRPLVVMTALGIPDPFASVFLLQQ